MSDYPKNNYPKPERKYTILDDRKLCLTAYVKEKSAVSQLTVNVWSNNPSLQFNLFSNKNQSDNERFQARFTQLEFQAFLEIIKHLAETTEPDVTYPIDCYKEVEREPVFDIKIVAGKDEKSGVFIGAIKDGFPPRKYYLRPGKLFKLGYNKDEINPVKQSEFFAKAFYTLFSTLVPQVAFANYERGQAPGAKKPNSGGGGNNYAQSKAAPQAISDDDISW